MTNTVTFNQSTYEQLQKEYDFAVKNNKKTFSFLGNELLTEYAKYMIEYLKTKFE